MSGRSSERRGSLSSLFLLTIMVIIFALSGGWFVLSELPYISKKEPGNLPIRTLSIIIPVRNEEHTVPKLLDSLAMQSIQPHQVIIVDDDSTDQTVAVASRYDVEIKLKDKQSKKDGFVGKTAACYRGSISATGDWIVFIDADTYFDHQDSLRDICQEFSKHSASGLLTIQPYHITKKLYEQLSAPLNMIVVAGLNSFTILKSHLKTGGAFGPFLMCSAEEYWEIGGHKKILDSHLDNFMLTKLYQSHQLPVRNYGGKGTVSFRMYPEGPRQWLSGWSKSLANGSSNTHPLVMTAVALWIIGGFLIPILIGLSLLLSVSIIWLTTEILMYAVYAGLFYWLAGKVGRFPFWLFLLYPVLLLAFVTVYCWSFIQVHILHTVTWRGRKIKV